MFLCDSLWFGFFCQIKEQHPQPASLIFCFELPTGSLFLQNVRNWSLFPCKWMSDIGHVCSIYPTLCRSPALPLWPLRGGATFRPRSLACQGMLKKRINQSRLQIQLNFLSTCVPTFPSSSDTDKHTCYSLSSCLALTHSLILGIWRVAMQTITKELLLRHWCTESAYKSRLGSRSPENKSQTCLTFLKCQNVSKDFLWRRVESPFYPNDKERNVAHDAVKGHVGVDGAAVPMWTFSLQFQDSTKPAHLPRSDTAKQRGTSET